MRCEGVGCARPVRGTDSWSGCAAPSARAERPRSGNRAFPLDPVAVAMTESAHAPRGEYWDWLAVALFLLLSVDLLTTLAAARAVGTGAEANPIVGWALGQGIWTLLAINLAVLVVAVVLFAGVASRIDATPPPFDRYVGLLVEIWLGALVAVGLAIFANNLSVIVLGQSLL